MKQRIFDKLRDRWGVTILMALFAMLVASMVCIVILGAAVTTVKQAKADQTQEQNTLTLQSAGELILSEIQRAGKITFEETVSDGGKPTYEVSPSFEHGDDSSLKSELSSVAAAMLKTDEGSASFKVSASTSAQDPAYAQTVQASMYFKRGTDASGESDSSSQLTITLDLHDPSDSADVSTIVQTLYLRVGCTIETRKDPVKDTEGNETGTKYETTLTWGDPRFYLAEDVSQNA